MVCIPLTPRHRAGRRWAAEHPDWEQHDWSHAVYRRVPIQSRVRYPTCSCVEGQGTRNNPAFVRERSQYRRAGWMVWVESA
ncbi:hypothetical protein TNCV_1294591 [Trichonephila clavipes]|nr:hypothetical protein TNCV_1294591 [Trichonephila clavipes]